MAERDEVLGMKVIILDRDNQKLEFLKSAVLKARPDASVRLFQDTDRLLEAVRDLVPDVSLRSVLLRLQGFPLRRSTMLHRFRTMAAVLRRGRVVNC